MKSIHFLLILMTVFFSYPTLVQSYETDDFDPQIEEQMIAGQDFDSELVPTVSDELSSPEDILYPEGEDSSWSLGSEDLPAEEYE